MHKIAFGEEKNNDFCWRSTPCVPRTSLFSILTYLLDVVLETTTWHDQIINPVEDFNIWRQKAAFNSQVQEWERITPTSENVTLHSCNHLSIIQSRLFELSWN